MMSWSSAGGWQMPLGGVSMMPPPSRGAVVPPPPPRPVPLTLCQVNAAAVGQAQQIAASGRFAGFSAVLSHVLAAYNVHDWMQLGVSASPLDTPCLAYLWKVDQQVGSAVASFAGLRGIATLADLDAEVSSLLRSMCIPTLLEIAKAISAGPQHPPGRAGTSVASNPEEIQLPDEDDDGSDADKPAEQAAEDYHRKGFDSFGVGPLLGHPAVQHYFQPSLQLMGTGISACSLSASDIYPHLTTFLQQDRPTSSGLQWFQEQTPLSAGKKRQRGSALSTEAPGMDIAGFTKHLTQALDITDLREVGIRLSPAGLAAEAQVLAAVAAAQEAALVEEKKRALARLSQEDADRRRSAVEEAKQRAPPRPNSTAGGSVPKLKLPVHKRVAKFVAACESNLEGPWRPSFAKMRGVVGMRMQNETSDTANEELLDVATEYAMLHLGGSRHFMKRLDLTGQAGDDTPSPETSSGAAPSEPTSVHAEKSSPDSSKSDHSSSSSSSSSESEEMDKERQGVSADPSRPSEVCEPRDSVAEAQGTNVTRVTAQDGLRQLPGNSNSSFEAERRPPPNAHTPLAISGERLQACIPWHQSLDRQDPRAIGRWGEALAYQYLLSQYPDWGVTWLNRDEETRAAYDIELTRPGKAHHETIFVEVKTTAHSRRNVFELTLWEWEFASKSAHQYVILRVYNAGSPGGAGIHVLPNPYEAVQQHKMGLCLVY